MLAALVMDRSTSSIGTTAFAAGGAGRAAGMGSSPEV